MLAIELELLTGRYVATSYDDREAAEWPPHPARVFSALVATWALGGESEVERAALEWLEAQPPPKVIASRASHRTVVPVFVPVNDVQTVTQPSRAREELSAAEADVADAAEGPGHRKMASVLEKARTKLRDETARQIAASADASAEAFRRARAVLPDGRLRQPRSFPSVVPDEPRFALAWDSDAPMSVRAALADLCERMVRVGHSSSLVRAVVADRADGDAFVPDNEGDEVLRVPRAGQLAALVEAHASHGEVEPRVLPCRFARYRRGARTTSPSPVRGILGDDWIVFVRHGGAALSTLATVGVGRALRGALLHHADQPPPRILTGHEADGTPAAGAHVAYVPLPFVGSAFADGRILGVAVVLPRDIAEAERSAVLRSVARWEQAARDESGRSDDETPPLALVMGSAGVLSMRRVAFGLPGQATVRTGTWTRPSCRWATATPIALDRNPGDLHDPDPERRRRAFAEAEESVRVACEHARLARPSSVDVLRSAVLPGTEKPVRFAPFPPGPGKMRRVLVHARICFDKPVEGPLLLGAGRYFGLGLCRPVDGSADAE